MRAVINRVVRRADERAVERSPTARADMQALNRSRARGRAHLVDLPSLGSRKTTIHLARSRATTATTTANRWLADDEDDERRRRRRRRRRDNWRLLPLVGADGSGEFMKRAA